ncbi:hypothetical protein R6Q59_012732 [Mikania micrantha]
MTSLDNVVEHLSHTISSSSGGFEELNADNLHQDKGKDIILSPAFECYESPIRNQECLQSLDYLDSYSGEVTYDECVVTFQSPNGTTFWLPIVSYDLKPRIGDKFDKLEDVFLKNQNYSKVSGFLSALPNLKKWKGVTHKYVRWKTSKQKDLGYSGRVIT